MHLYLISQCNLYKIGMCTGTVYTGTIYVTSKIIVLCSASMVKCFLVWNHSKLSADQWDSRSLNTSVLQSAQETVIVSC